MLTSPCGCCVGISDHAVLSAIGSRDGLMRTSSWLRGLWRYFVCPRFSRRTTSVQFDVWLRELFRTGLSPTARQEMLARLANTIDRRAPYIPDAPMAHVARAKELLLSAFLPQVGPYIFVNAPPAASERISRSRAWELVYSELSMLDGSRIALHDLHIVLVDVICMIARNDFPLTIPPR